jgi:hypothetical protein
MAPLVTRSSMLAGGKTVVWTNAVSVVELLEGASSREFR